MLKKSSYSTKCMPFVVLIMIISLLSYFFKNKINLKEHFESETPIYTFRSPVSFENSNKLRFSHNTSFEGNVHFEDSRRIRMNKVIKFTWILVYFF